MEDDDHKLLKHDVKSSAKPKQTTTPADKCPETPTGAADAPPTPDAGGSAAASGSKAKVHITGAHTPEWARGYLPPVAGVWIRLDQVRHFRWQAGYPRAKTPRSHGIAFGAGDAILPHESLRGVLIWIWQIHHEETGKECPYQFDV